MSQNVKVFRTLEFYYQGGATKASTIDTDDSGSIVYWRPETNDTGALYFGDGTKDFDVRFYLGSSTKYVEFNVGDSYFNLEDIDFRLGDNDVLRFGDGSGGDVRVAWDGSLLQFLPATDDTGYVAIGDGTLNMDFMWYADSPAKSVRFDGGDVLVRFEDVDLEFGDNDQIQFGDAAGGDVSMKWDGSLLQFLPATNDTGYIAIGNGSLDMDFWVYTGVGNYVQVDVGNDYLSLINISLYAPNLASSVGQAGIIYAGADGVLRKSP